MPRIITILGLVGLMGLVACGAEQPKMVAGKNDDGVPANSASEERLNADARSKTTAPPSEELAQPLTTPMNGDASAAATAPAGKASGKGGKGPKEKPEPKGGANKVSKAECKQLFDRYIDLTIGSDTRFEGIPPEMIAQLKEQALSQAQSQKGDPCNTQEVSRTQYQCAVSAPTTAAWTRCMK